ncbi:hypothetical protein ACLB2K_040117 [Fragaria x ananassa]
MRGRKNVNAMRLAVVVLGLAFGYLILQLGFKPYILKVPKLLLANLSSLLHHSNNKNKNNLSQAQPTISKWASEENG